MLEFLVILIGLLFLASGFAAVVPMEDLRRKTLETLEMDHDFKHQAIRRTLVSGIRAGICWALLVFLMPWTIPDTPPPAFGTGFVLAIAALVTGAVCVLFLWGNAHFGAWWLENTLLPVWRQREARRTPLPEEKAHVRASEPVDWT